LAEFRYVRGMAEVGTVYGACRGRITELVRDLDDERAVARFTADGPAAPLPT
jgi:hypothetical protein